MKILILVFASTLAIIANAAATNWAAIETTECDYATATGTDDIANYAMYYCTTDVAVNLFGGTSVDKIESYIAKNFATAKSKAITFDSVAFSDDEYHILDYADVGTVFESADYVAFAIYGDDAYRVYGEGSAVLTPYGDLVFNESTAASGSVGDWQQTTPTPEPTSGILMLLGLVGLALRRKQK